MDLVGHVARKKKKKKVPRIPQLSAYAKSYPKEPLYAKKSRNAIRSFAPTSNTTHNCYPFNAEIKAVRYSILTMEGPNLRDEAVRDRIRLAEEFLDRGK